MRKLFSVICSIFLLYSAFVIEPSRAGLFCALSHKDPSMIYATMFELGGHDRGNMMVKIKIEAPKNVAASFDLQSCHLHANSNDISDINERTLLIPMRPYDLTSPTLVKFNGQARLPMDFGSLGHFRVYCPLNGADIVTAKFPMKMEVETAQLFIETRDDCKVLRHDRIAESVKVYSPLDMGIFRVEIKNIVKPIVKGSAIGIGYLYPTADITRGTYGEYKMLGRISCFIDGKQGLAYAFERNYHIQIQFTYTPNPKTTHIIDCPFITATITSGSRYIPSIMKLIDYGSQKTTPATNIYLF